MIDFKKHLKANAQQYMVFDWETFSEADIKQTGAWEYSLHPSTEILCVCFRIGTMENIQSKATLTWIPGRESTAPAFAVFLAALRNPKINLVAHNRFFEHAILVNVFAKRMMPSKPELLQIPISRWDCTAARSRALGFPGKLEAVGEALELPFQKDKEGHRHMLKVCRPRKPTKDNPATRHNSKADIDRLVEYCKSDIAPEVELHVRLPFLVPKERQFWEMDQAMNQRGFQVDRALVHGALALIYRESARLDKRVQKITGGKIQSARQRDAVLKYLRRKGFPLPNLRAGTVKEVLAAGTVDLPACRELLEIREAISRSSTAKYKAFEVRSRSDGRARDNLIYGGAHTLRDAGTGLQPQNLFKTVLNQEDVEAALDLIKRQDYHTIEALFDKPMDLYASALRSCIVSKPGHVLEVGDFATIEVRVLFWLAGHQAGLDALEAGICLYSDQASEIFEESAEEILAGHKAGDKDFSFKRQLGKQTVLGGGFGIGINGVKFQLTCKQYGMNIPLSLAQKAVRAYRTKNPRIPAFWSNTEKAALMAMQNPGKAYRCGFLVWKKEGDFLTVKLPIGRKMHYFKPEVRRLPTLYGEKPTLTFLTSKNGKLYRVKTWGGELVQNCTQAVSRDLLKESQLALELEGISLPVLAVHDEEVCEREKKARALKTFISTMSKVPEWAKGLPVKVEGWEAPRYRK